MASCGPDIVNYGTFISSEEDLYHERENNARLITKGIKEKFWILMKINNYKKSANIMPHLSDGTISAILTTLKLQYVSPDEITAAIRASAVDSTRVAASSSSGYSDIDRLRFIKDDRERLARYIDTFKYSEDTYKHMADLIPDDELSTILGNLTYTKEAIGCLVPKSKLEEILAHLKPTAGGKRHHTKSMRKHYTKKHHKKHNKKAYSKRLTKHNRRQRKH